jgi:exosortase/archaeosortase family protein
MLAFFKQRINFLKEEYQRRKKIIKKIIFFVMIFFVYRFLRGSYTEIYHGYALRGGDSINVYAPYIIIFLSVVLNWEKLKAVIFKKISFFSHFSFFCLGILVSLVPATFFASSGMALYLGELGIELSSGIFFFLAIFGIRFYRQFTLEIHLAMLITLVLELSAAVTDLYWKIFSSITIFSLQFLLPFINKPYVIVKEDYLVTVDTFPVSIGPACAGIGFLTGYITLFIFSIALLLGHGKKIHWYKISGIFIGGLCAMFLLNSLRVFLILAIGVYYSQEFAITLFHNGIGAVLFLLFFFFFTQIFIKKAIDIEDHGGSSSFL